MNKQLKQQETKLSYIVDFRGETTIFAWSSTQEEKLKSSVDLKVKTKPPEILCLAENLGCLFGQRKVFASNLDVYNRLLIYACVRPTVKSVEKAATLATLVLEINSYDAQYWASRFRELWWRHGNYKHLLKAVKAFKLFFNFE
ncbi:MAG: hypothetical protein QXV01_06080 [Candidatus Bathyarchaeia archaeon]